MASVTTGEPSPVFDCYHSMSDIMKGPEQLEYGSRESCTIFKGFQGVGTAHIKTPSYGWLSKLGSFLGSSFVRVPYYLGDRRGDPNLGNDWLEN